MSETDTVAGVSKGDVYESDFRLSEGRRPVAGAVLLHHDGRVLLQHRDDKPDIDSPGQWSLFGGGLDEDETPQAAMCRELGEEIDFSPTAYRPLLLLHGWTTVFHVYLAGIDRSLEQLTLREGQGFGYFGINEALQHLDLTEVARIALEATQLLQRQAPDDAALLPG